MMQDGSICRLHVNFLSIVDTLYHIHLMTPYTNILYEDG